jgi:hypothetical protein
MTSHDFFYDECIYGISFISICQATSPFFQSALKAPLVRLRYLPTEIIGGYVVNPLVLV